MGLQSSNLWVIKSNKANTVGLTGHHVSTSSVSYENCRHVLPKTDHILYLFCQDLSAAVYDTVFIYNICWRHHFFVVLVT
jgi:hypothetical protein